MARDALGSQLGHRLRTLRQVRGETLADVAESVGLSPSTISRIESGRRGPSLDALQGLCGHYGVTIHDALGTEPLRGDGYFERASGDTVDALLHAYPLPADADMLLGTHRHAEGHHSSAYHHHAALSAAMEVSDSGTPDRPNVFGHARTELATAMDALLAVLDHHDHVVRYQACRTLAMLASVPLETLSEVALQDVDSRVRDAARQLLATLGEAYEIGE